MYLVKKRFSIIHLCLATGPEPQISGAHVLGGVQALERVSCEYGAAGDHAHPQHEGHANAGGPIPLTNRAGNLKVSSCGGVYV